MITKKRNNSQQKPICSYLYMFYKRDPIKLDLDLYSKIACQIWSELIV